MGPMALSTATPSAPSPSPLFLCPCSCPVVPCFLLSKVVRKQSCLFWRAIVLYETMTAVEGTSSTFRATVNLAKVCIGAGVLALPYAIEKGGLLLGPIVIGLVAGWNAVACRMMIECKKATAHLPVPSGLSATYSIIAYHGAGFLGVYLTDFSLVVTLLGVCVAFQITFSTLLAEIAQIELSKNALLLLSFVLLSPVCVVNDVSRLSIFSLAGLVCLIIGIIAILTYGTFAFGAEAMSSPWSSTPDLIDSPSLALFPSSFSGASTFFGVAAFCFGLCSMAFPIEESMRHKEDFSKAVAYSLLFVWAVYAVIGDMGALLFIHDSAGIKDNILRNLPSNQFCSAIVQFSMALVCLFTYPLTFVAPAQIVETYAKQINLRQCWNRLFMSHSYQPVRGHDTVSPTGSIEHHAQSVDTFGIITRLVLLLGTTYLAFAVPCFGMIISLLGAFTVSITSFVLPPLLHLNILSHPTQRRISAESLSKLPQFVVSAQDDQFTYYQDVAYLAVGLTLTVLATTISFVGFMHQLGNGMSC